MRKKRSDHDLRLSHAAMVGIILTVGISLPSVFAQEQVTIPLGAANQNTPFALSPAVLNIKAGDTVVWQNDDKSSHTVTTGTYSLGFDGRVDSGVISSGNSFSYKFDKSGVYNYFCLFHPWMTGIVNVGDGTPLEPIITISASTDKQSYTVGDTITVSGQVSKFIPNDEVTVWVTDEQGNGIAKQRIETKSSNSFSMTISTTDKLWIPGQYTVYAQYGPGSNVAYANIIMTSQANSANNISEQQSTNVSESSQIQNSVTTHIAADSNNAVVVQSSHNLYEPGDQVTIQGAVWNGIIMQIGPAYLVTVSSENNNQASVSTMIKTQIIDSNGNVVGTKESPLDGNDDYQASFSLPDNSPLGEYTVMSTIEIKTGLIGALDTSTSARLASSCQFLVSSPTDFAIKTSDGYSDVKIASNSTISGFGFEPDKKAISFTVEGQTGTKGVTEITIPKQVLGGQLSVSIDGAVQSSADKMLVTSDTSDSTTIELNYHHSTHTVQIVGTESAAITSIPEFGPLAGLIITTSVIGSVMISRKYFK